MIFRRLRSITSILSLFIGLFLLAAYVNDNDYYDKMIGRIFASGKATTNKEKVWAIFQWVTLQSPGVYPSAIRYTPPSEDEIVKSWLGRYDELDKSDLEKYGTFYREFKPQNFNPLIRYYEKHTPLGLTAREVIQWGGDIDGPCGALTRVFIVLGRRAKLKIRKLQLCSMPGDPERKWGHTVAEAYLDGRWVVFDCSSNFCWVKDNGELASVADLASDETLYKSILNWRPKYMIDKLHYRHSVYHFRFTKIPIFGGLIFKILKHFIGDKVKEIETPYIYERPKLLVACFFLLLAAILAITVISFKRILKQCSRFFCAKDHNDAQAGPTIFICLNTVPLRG